MFKKLLIGTALLLSLNAWAGDNNVCTYGFKKLPPTAKGTITIQEYEMKDAGSYQTFKAPCGKSKFSAYWMGQGENKGKVEHITLKPDPIVGEEPPSSADGGYISLLKNAQENCSCGDNIWCCYP